MKMIEKYGKKTKPVFLRILPTVFTLSLEGGLGSPYINTDDIDCHKHLLLGYPSVGQKANRFNSIYLKI
jgi:hypothetical protein